VKKPSVSELVDLLAKPALITWANKMGLQGIDVKQKRKKSLANGSSLHAQIDGFCKGTSDFEDESYRQRFQNFLSDKVLIDSEVDIETEWFVGRYDAKIRQDDCEYIIDYKSGFKGKIYLEQKLQLVAYAMANKQSVNLAIVAIPQFVLVPVQIKNFELYKNMLITLSNLYYIKKEIDRE
jgi:hypothetical protein